MKEGFRQCMAWLHTWVGLVVGWVLFFVFVTGTAGYATYELDRWMRPELPLVAPSHVAQADMLAKAESFLEKRGKGAAAWTISLPGERGQPNLGVTWQEPPKVGEGRRGRSVRATLDAQTGEEIKNTKVRDTGGGHVLYRMHYRLHYISYDVALRFVGICTMLMFVAIISGVITHKKIFADFFTFRPGKGQRSWLDAHNLISVMALPFFVMITYSGLLFYMFQYMPLGVTGVYGQGEQQLQKVYDEVYQRRGNVKAGAPAARAPLLPIWQASERIWGEGQVRRITIRHPGREGSEVVVSRISASTLARATEELKFDGVTGTPVPGTTMSNSRQFHSVITGLHIGRFATPFLRWLYVISGFLGAAMIATGLVLWTVKRRVKQDKLVKAGEKHEFGFRLVECLNIGTIAGLPFAVAVYFWANRLLPVAMEGRRAWEVHAMFIAWGLALLYPAFRSSMRAWIEVLWSTAAAFALLPILNVLTTERHLGVTLAAGDWALVSIDLSFFALGLFFAAAARKVQRKLEAVPLKKAAVPKTKPDIPPVSSPSPEPVS